jgi:hypothetical protein
LLNVLQPEDARLGILRLHLLADPARVLTDDRDGVDVAPSSLRTSVGILAEGGRRNEAAALGLEPPSASAALGVADVRKARLPQAGGTAYPGASSRVLAHDPGHADHGRHAIRKDRPERWHVAGKVALDTEEPAHGVLPFVTE